MQKSSRAGRAGAATATSIGLPTRSLSPEEFAYLLRRFRSPGARVLRVVGILFGLGAVVLTLTWFVGFPYDPNVIPWEILIVGILSAGCTAAGAGMVRDVRFALEAGQVVDPSGTLVPSANAPPGFTELQVGSLLLQLPTGRTTDLVMGPPQRLSLALGLRPVANRRVAAFYPDRALLVSVNGVLRDRPTVVCWRALAPGTTWGPSGPGFFTAPTPALPSAFAAAPTPNPTAEPSLGSGADVFCDRCGHANAAGFLFCRSCGAPHSVVGG
ncbi:MAG: zinc ribbon domain-containing protein [Thermoplasmata archaeon]